MQNISTPLEQRNLFKEHTHQKKKKIGFSLSVKRKKKLDLNLIWPEKSNGWLETDFFFFFYFYKRKPITNVLCSYHIRKISSFRSVKCFIYETIQIIPFQNIYKNSIENSS